MFRPVVPQHGHHLLQPGQRFYEGLDTGDLGADVETDTRNLEVLRAACLAVQFGGCFDRDAELVLPQTGRNVGMGLRVHVGIHSQGNAGGLVAGCRPGVQDVQLGRGFDVELQDARVQGEIDLVFGLAHAGEHDLLRIRPGPQRPLKLSARDDVEPGPESPEKT